MAVFDEKGGGRLIWVLGEGRLSGLERMCSSEDKL